MSEALKDARLITSSLRRSRRSMEYGVLQADSAITTLMKDKEIIDKTLNTHKHELKNELLSSNNRLNRMKRIQVIEKYSLKFSVYFFICVVCYIIAKRTRLLFLGKLVIRQYSLLYNNKSTIDDNSSINIHDYISNKHSYNSATNDKDFINLSTNDHNKLSKESLDTAGFCTTETNCKTTTNNNDINDIIIADKKSPEDTKNERIINDDSETTANNDDNNDINVIVIVDEKYLENGIISYDKEIEQFQESTINEFVIDVESNSDSTNNVKDLIDVIIVEDENLDSDNIKDGQEYKQSQDNRINEFIKIEETTPNINYFNDVIIIDDETLESDTIMYDQEYNQSQDNNRNLFKIDEETTYNINDLNEVKIVDEEYLKNETILYDQEYEQS